MVPEHRRLKLHKAASQLSRPDSCLDCDHREKVISSRHGGVRQFCRRTWIRCENKSTRCASKRLRPPVVPTADASGRSAGTGQQRGRNMTHSLACAWMALGACLASALPLADALAASHREAPVTAIDRTADITDWYAFVSPDAPDTVTMILAVDPLLEPGNGPNYFPFDDNLLYELNVDNDQDASEDVTFRVRFKTEIRAPGVPVGFIGAGDGIGAPSNSPPPIAPVTPLIPPAITALDGPGSEGLSLRQTYEVTMVRGRKEIPLSGAGPLFAVPSNVGPRTMPNYADLMNQGIYDLDQGVRVFAG